MPIMRSPLIASAIICRYRGSKMCSGRKTLGKRTTFGSGNSGNRSDMGSGQVRSTKSEVRARYRHAPYFELCTSYLVNGLRLLVHVVHQDVLPERVRCREVCL